MQYANLHDLVSGSSSARAYFLSLPTQTQMQLHQQNAFIHSSEQLHRQAALLERYRHAVEVADSLPSWFQKDK